MRKLMLLGMVLATAAIAVDVRMAGWSTAVERVTTHASVDLASVATAACTAETTETINGLSLADACIVSSATALEAGGFFKCSVTAANTAKWQLCNLSGGAIDRASTTYTIRSFR